MQGNEQMTSQIKCYLKLYHTTSLHWPESHPPINYEILDENTLLRKTNKSSKQNYQLYAFNKVFSSRISNSLITQSIRFIDDLYEGINHTMIAMLNQQTQQPFTTGILYSKQIIQVITRDNYHIGTVDQYGLLIEMYLALHNDKRIKYKSNSVITLSMFATVHEKPNQFIDLLNGQRYRYLSRRDVDTQSYKVFYQVRVKSVKEYLVAMKIAIIRFKECCEKNDFLVWRIKLSNYDELSQHKTMATGNIVICQQGCKNTDTFIRQLANLVEKSPQPTNHNNNHSLHINNPISSRHKNTHPTTNTNIHSSQGNSNKVTDHGSLFSCLQGYLRNGKVSVMVCLMNDYDDIEKHLELIKWVRGQLMGKLTQCRINPQPVKLVQFIKQAQLYTKITNQTILKKFTHKLPFLSIKQIQKFKQLYSTFKLFIKDSVDKLTLFVKLFRYCLQVREEFFERERFPVGIEIKTLEDIHSMVKRFFIAKIYSLSEKYQMQNLQGTCEKMMTIKNQLQISLKTLTAIVVNNSKKQHSTDSLSKSYVLVSTSRKNHRESLLLDEQENGDDLHDNDPSTIKYEKILRLMRTHLQKVKKYLKYILNMSPRYWDENEHIQQQQQQQLLQNNNNHENRELKFHHVHHHFIVLLQSANFGKLLGQELFVEIEKQLKNLGYKKQLSMDVELVSPRKERESVVVERNDSQDGNDNNKPVRNQLKKKTILLNQRSQRSVITNRINLPPQPLSLLQINPLQALKIQKTILQRQQQSLERSLMKIKQAQIQKHLKIRQRISEYEENKMKQQTHVEEIKDDNKQRQKHLLALPKKSSQKLIRLARIERQMGAFSNYELYDSNKKREKYIKAQTVNATTSPKQQDNKSSIVGKVNHNRQETNATSIHVDDPITGVMKKYNSLGKLKYKRRESQSAMFPDISKSVDQRVSVINSFKSNGGIPSSQQLAKAQSLPKLKKKQVSKEVRNSLHLGDNGLTLAGQGINNQYKSPRRMNKKDNYENDQSKSFLPEICLVCRKIPI